MRTAPLPSQSPTQAAVVGGTDGVSVAVVGGSGVTVDSVAVTVGVVSEVGDRDAVALTVERADAVAVAMTAVVVLTAVGEREAVAVRVAVAVTWAHRLGRSSGWTSAAPAVPAPATSRGACRYSLAQRRSR